MSRKNIVWLLFCMLTCFVFRAHAQHNNYGVEEANTKFSLKEGVLGGDTGYDYLSLKDHEDTSGVPLGGIGVGNINLSPSGQFTRIGINNIHMPIKRSDASFFSLWSHQHGKKSAVRLVRDESLQLGMKGVEHTQYTGLFPTAELHYENNGLPVTPVIRAWSGLVPHNLKDSSLPVVWFEIDLESREDTEVSLAFSWEDFIGLYTDPQTLEGLDFGQLLTGNRSELSNGERWPLWEKAETRIRPCDLPGWKGLVQYATDSLRPRKMTFQNYVDQVWIAVEQDKDQEITYLPAYDPASGEKAWKDFIDRGRFDTASAETLLSPSAGASGASALAVKTRLQAGKKKTIRLMLAWWAPEIHIDKTTAPRGSYWPYGADYNKYYHNFFRDMPALVSYAQANRARILRQTTEWHLPILESTLPDWYKFKLINCGYVIYTNIVHNKKGDVMSNEGAMGGFGGTMDQRISSHPFYQKFFTGLDRSEMDIFADSMDPDGYILHFIGHYYVGMGTVGGRVPTEKGYTLDNSSGWIIQLAKDYEQTGDLDYLRKHIVGVKQALNFLRSCMPEGSQIPVGATTYDDFPHPPLYSYYAGVWLTTLKACEAIAEALDDHSLMEYARRQFDISREEVLRKLWNGRFFAYGCEPDGSKRLDSVLCT
ncbi:MAG: non-lysosomal glucosylceramidase, partial [Bacteroides sp.]|nr:non-lysosomal glucosylceramidase [Bacteroides sp.]